jgi:hypothetical protein
MRREWVARPKDSVNSRRGKAPLSRTRRLGDDHADSFSGRLKRRPRGYFLFQLVRECGNGKVIRGDNRWGTKVGGKRVVGTAMLH